MAAKNVIAPNDVDSELIELVKSTPSLYDPRCRGFRSPQCKEQNWEYISDHLGLTTDEVKKRWTSLRERYSRGLRQLRQNPDNQEMAQNDFFKEMDFLRTFIKKRRGSQRGFKSVVNWNNIATKTEPKFNDDVSNYDNKDSINFDQSGEFSDSNEVQDYDDIVEPRSSKISSTIPSQSLQSQERSTQDPLGGNVETEDDFFCKSIAAYLKQLSRCHKIKAKIEMFQVLEKYIEVEENMAMLE